MKIYISGRGHEINLKGLLRLGFGTEGTVYIYNGMALKIYHKNRETFICKPTTEKIDYFKSMETTYFNFPKEYVLDKDGKLIGHLSPLISNEKPIEIIYKEDINYLIEMAKKINLELNKINEHFILLSDFDFYRNFVFNGKIYFIDFDLALLYNNFKEEFIQKKLDKTNLYAVNEFFVINLLLARNNKEEFYDYQKRIFAEQIIESLSLDTIPFADFLEKEVKDTKVKTLGEITKKIIMTK